MRILSRGTIVGALIFSLAMAGGTTASARTLSPEEALQRARGEMASPLSRSGHHKLVYTNTPASRSAAPAYYVFADPDDPSGGYLITTADTRLRAILGYSDEGTFDPQSLPENLVGWLDGYEREIEAYLATDPEEPTLSRAPGSELSALYAQWQPIEPMVVTKWNQDEPYNNHCPTVNGQHTLTGCVATAMAQILYYHKWADCHGTATNRSTGTTVTYVFDNHKFDWDNMTPTYGSSSTTAENNAVADLMHACGMAVNMNYGLGGSGAMSSYVPTALINFFGYDSATQYYGRDGYTSAEWESKIYDYLTHNGPVYYSGTYSIGHAFVLDGYDTNGYYHFNWGWGGGADGYFALSSLRGDDGNYDGFSIAQGIVLIYKPTDTNKPGIEDKISDYNVIVDSKIPAGTILYVDDNPTVTFSLINTGTTNFNSAFNVQVVHKQTGDRHQLAILGGMVDGGDCINITVPLALNRDPVPAGDYLLIAKNTSEEELFSQDVIVREGSKPTIVLPTSEDIIVQKGQYCYEDDPTNYTQAFPKNVEQGRVLKFGPWIRNNGSETKNISLVLKLYAEGSDEASYTSGSTSINAKPGYVSYEYSSYSDLPLGIWNAKFVDENANEIISRTWELTVSKNFVIGDATIKISGVDGKTTVVGIEGSAAYVNFGDSDEPIQMIGKQAFERDITLTSVVIPESVEEIGYNAFRLCGNLRSVTFEGIIPPFKRAEGIFYGINGDCVFNVPSSAYDAYYPLLSKFGRIETFDDAGKVGPVELTVDVAAPVRYAVVNYRGLSLDKGGVRGEMTVLGVGADGKPAVSTSVNDDALWYFTSGDTDGAARFHNVGQNKSLQAVTSGATSYDMVDGTASTPLFIKRNGINTAGFAISTAYPFEEQTCLDTDGMILTSGSKPSDDDWGGSTWLFVKIPDGATAAEIDALCRDAYAAAHPDKLASLDEYMESQRTILSTLYAVTPWTDEAYSQLTEALDNITYNSETMSLTVVQAVNDAKDAFTTAALEAVQANIGGEEIALRNVRRSASSMKYSYAGYNASVTTIPDALTTYTRVTSDAVFRLDPVAGSENAYRLVNTSTGKYLAELPSGEGGYLTFTDNETGAATLALGFFLDENPGMTLTSTSNGNAVALTADEDIQDPATASAVGSTSTWLVINPDAGSLPAATTLPEITENASRPVRYAIVNYRGKANTDEEDRYEDPSMMSMLSVSSTGSVTTTDTYSANALWYFTPGSDDDSFIFHNIGNKKALKAVTSSTGSTYSMVSESAATALLVKPNGVNDKGLAITTAYPFTTYSCFDSQRYYPARNNLGLSTGWYPRSSDWMGTTWIFVPIDDNMTEADILERCRTAYVNNRSDLTEYINEQNTAFLSAVENLTPWSRQDYNELKTAINAIEITPTTTVESYNATANALIATFAEKALQGVLDNLDGTTVSLQNIRNDIYNKQYHNRSYMYFGYAESLTLGNNTFSNVAATLNEVTEDAELTFENTGDADNSFRIVHNRTGKYLALIPSSANQPLIFTDNINNAAKVRIGVSCSIDDAYSGLTFLSINSSGNMVFNVNYVYTVSSPVYAYYLSDNGSKWRMSLAGASAFTPGDVDGNGVVDINDVTKTVEYVVNHDDDSIILEAADLDNNSVVDVADVVGIVNIVVGAADMSRSVPDVTATYFVEPDGSLWIDTPEDIAGVQATLKGGEWIPGEILAGMSRAASAAGSDEVTVIAFGNAWNYITAGRRQIATLPAGTTLIGTLTLSDPMGHTIKAVDATLTSVDLPEAVSAPVETGRYDIYGRAVGEGHRGLTVIRMSDGTVKKVNL